MGVIKANALTNKDRIKTRLGVSSSDFDTLLDNLINGISDFCESYCNRKFIRATYSNEIYPYDGKIDMLALKNAPVISVSSLQYRAGTPSTPSWTSFTADQYELSGDGNSGLVKLYGGFNAAAINSLRATYVAGYLVDFTNIDDPTKHTLPSDLTDLAERLVIKRFKKRDLEGRTSETYNGATTTWGSFLEDEDKITLDRYRRLPVFV